MFKKPLVHWFVVLLFHLCNASQSWGQAGIPPPGAKGSFSTPSPTVASLGKYGLTPVAYYTGIPQINIPIWEVKSNKLRLPISLSYNNNGLKVAEEASWVGLGWALQAGGIITRSVRGIPDGSTGFPYQLPPTSLSTSEYQIMINLIAQGKQDSSPDIFIFNFGEYSGRFIFYEDKVYQFTYSDLSIKYNPQLNNFTIIAGDGTVYNFFKQERSVNETFSSGNVTSTNTASWLLTEITSADGTDTIKFLYDDKVEEYITPTGLQVQDNYQGFPSGASTTTMNEFIECVLYDRTTPGETQTTFRTTTTAYRLARIESQSERIEFVPQPTSRLDVNGTAYALASIRIYDKLRSIAAPIRTFSLQQSYFTDSYSQGAITPANGRLKLVGLQEEGENRSQKPPYTFSYQDGSFPLRSERSVDHWGFFNGARNTSLIPATPSYPRGTANRTPNFQAAQLGVLQKITYPTGGSELFIYEQNRYYQNLTSTEEAGPGLRVSQITTQSTTGQLTYRKFNYTSPIDDKLIPQYEKTMLTNPGTDCNCLSVSVTGGNPDILSMFGSVVYYTKVVETLGLQGEGGQTEYHYQGIGDKMWSNGMHLVKKIVRTADYHIVSEEENQYGGAGDLSISIVINPTPAFGPYSGEARTLLPGPLKQTIGCILRAESCGKGSAPALTYKTEPNFGFMMSVYFPTFINLDCGWDALQSKTVRLYDTPISQSYTETTTRYFYDQSTKSSTGDYVHRYVTREETTDSHGQTHITRRRYPQEYNISAATGIDPYYNSLQKMVELHQVSIPVEQLSLVRKDNVTSALAGQLTLFKSYKAPINLQPAAVLSLEAGRALPDVNYSTTAGSTFTWDPHFVLRSTYRYDEIGKLRQTQQASGSPNSGIWGYHNTLLIAEAKNATYNSFAVTSFEPEATGRWQYDSTGYHREAGGRTGDWAYRLDGKASVSRGSLPAGDYEFSCWVQDNTAPIFAPYGSSPVNAGLVIYAVNGSGVGTPQLVANAAGNWHQYRARLRFSALGELRLDSPIGGATPLLDEVRLYPVGAQLTSYTYRPLIGLTSQTGSDGRTIFFDYDGLGRLSRTRDEQNRILSQQQYHYAGSK